MRGVPTDIGTIHFVGIGGIGTSGVAEVMANLGYTVQGSDMKESATVERLRQRGVKIAIGHAPENVEGAAVVVTSTAVKRTNPEVAFALENRIPVVRRAEMLAELMRLKSTVAVAGTHGKTTTTSMIAALLDAGNIDPTVINGGIIEQYGSNARLGDSEWMVVEADESDGSFLRLDGTIAVVTNIDPEHLDHYGDFDGVKDAFVEFIHNVPFYGAAILCIDHEEVQAVIGKVRDRNVVTYGFNLQADICGVNVRPDAGGNVKTAGSKACDCRCPGATMSRMHWPRLPCRSKWAAPTRSSAMAFPHSAVSVGGSPRWAKFPAAAALRRSSTITATTRWRSRPCWPPHARAQAKAASSRWSSRTVTPACAI